MTFSERFEHKFPTFYEAFIAEQIMVGAAMGLASRGAIPFSTLAVFLARRTSRMTGISYPNVKFAGSHVGVSIGETAVADGLEDRDGARPCRTAVFIERRRQLES